MLLSERLGPITEIERRLETEGAVVRAAALWTTSEIHLNAAGAAIIILGAVEPFDDHAMRALPALHTVVRRGVGHDNVDLAAATRLGIVVANVPDASVEEVSDHALAMLLSLERAIPWLDRAVRDGRWQRDPSAIEAIRAPIRRLGTLTLAVAGLGRIGRALVRKAHNTYGRVVASDPFVGEEDAVTLGVELLGMDEFMAAADHISVHAPLIPATRHLVSAESLALCRPGTILVNTSRGGLVDEAALIDAVKARRLRSAGLDVSEHEPLPADDPLVSVDGILLTAHSAASSTTTRLELAERSVDAALALLRGSRPDSIVNPDVLTSPKLRLTALRGR